LTNIFSNDYTIKRTKGSGNLHGDCDLVVAWSPIFDKDEKRLKRPKLEIAIDGKYSGNPAKDKDLEKAVKQAKQTGRNFGIIIRNSDSKIVGLKVEIRLIDLIELLDN
jgi:hypothetical protein